MKKISILLIITFLSGKIFSQNMYACFENDNKKNLKISVFFDQNNKAKFVKYKGQEETISLYFQKRRTEKNDGGHPAYYWFETYVEKYRGAITGTYTFTNTGTHGLDVNFKRKRDGKEFYFQIIEGSQDEDNFTFRTTPCF